MLYLLGTLIANVIGIIAASYWLPGFLVTGGPAAILVLSLILTGLNLVLKPILKLILGPIILLTLGIGLIVVNALVLYLLDILSANLTIQTIPTLIYATLIVSAVNVVVHLFVRK